MKKTKANVCLIALSAVLLSGSISGCGNTADSTVSGGGSIELLNVSYDPTREFYAAYNQLFCDYWKE